MCKLLLFPFFFFLHPFVLKKLTNSFFLLKTKFNTFQKFASKEKKTNKLVRDIYSKTGKLMEDIRDTADFQPAMDAGNRKYFLDQFKKALDKIPNAYKRMMKDEIKDVLNKPTTFSELMDFYQGINARIKGISGGKEVLGILKKPIREGMEIINPYLAEEYQLANRLYAKRFPIAKHLSRKEIDQLISV